AVGEYFCDRGAITETNRRAGRVDNQLLSEIAGQLLFVVEQQLFEFADVVKLAAIGKFAAGVDRQSVTESEFLSALGDALRQLTLCLGAIAFAPAAHDIEIFQ